MPLFKGVVAFHPCHMQDGKTITGAFSPLVLPSSSLSSSLTSLSHSGATTYTIGSLSNRCRLVFDDDAQWLIHFVLFQWWRRHRFPARSSPSLLRRTRTVRYHTRLYQRFYRSTDDLRRRSLFCIVLVLWWVYPVALVYVSDSAHRQFQWWADIAVKCS